MRPLFTKTLDKCETFVKIVSLLLSGFWVLNEAFLQIDCCDDGDAVAEEWIGDSKSFSVEHFDQVDDPGCVRSY